MEKFKKFVIKNQGVIIGGILIDTKYSNSGGGGGCDFYDSEEGRVVYLR